jgi:hypothetical protein
VSASLAELARLIEETLTDGGFELKFLGDYMT